MGRLILLCRRPSGLSREEGGAWLREFAASLLEAQSIDHVECTKLGSCANWPADYDWMLDIRSSSAGDGADIAVEPQVDDLMRELRALAMNPAMYVARETVPAAVQA